MALPNVKSTLIQHRTVLPDSKKTVKYHAMTSGDVKPFLLLKQDVTFVELVDNVKNVLVNCTDIENPDEISIIDMQHMFLQIHRASKGDDVQLVFVCPHIKRDGVKCGSRITHELDLKDVNVTPPQDDRVASVQIPDTNIELILKDFMIGDIDLLVADDENPNIDVNSMVDTVLLCIDSIVETTENGQIVHDQFTLEEIRNFFDQVPVSVVEEIETNYINKSSKLEHKFDVTCQNCGTKHPIVLDKLLDFFG